MDVNISRAADLFFPNPSLELVYYEAIANAIDAGSTKVYVKIKVKSLQDVDAFSLEILENGTAIIAGTGHIINDTKESIYQSSNILILRNGIWKAVLSHVSGYKNLE